MKILHITNWYPGNDNPYRVVWLRRLILTLNPYCLQTIYHIEIKKGKFNFKSNFNNDGSFFILISFPFTFWKINEIISSLIILWIYFIRERKSKFDIINFHIAYPNCTYLHIYRKWLKCPVVISEHWSGYHFNFNINKDTKRKNIKKIFHYNLPVISVSDALARDIKAFSEAEFPVYIIPNVVNTNIFVFSKYLENKSTHSFFMVSQWNWPKEPFVVIYAWEKLIKKFPDINLRIGGFGQQWEDMRNLILKLNLDRNVKLLGMLNEKEIAFEMQISDALIHCSHYETFSVVCAEALCCGTPVIASDVGGIREYIRDKNGMLVKKNNYESFYYAVDQFIKNHDSYDRKLISKEAAERFSVDVVGNLYFQTLTDIVTLEIKK